MVCTCRHALRLEWTSEAIPTIKEKTCIVMGDDEFIFDGFLLICQDLVQPPPMFEYKRHGIHCTIAVQVSELPLDLQEPNNGMRKRMQKFEKRFLWELLKIPPEALPEFSATELCSSMHLYPRFVSKNDQTQATLENVLAPNQLGFGIGRLLSLDILLDYLDATAKCTAEWFITEYSKEKISQHIVSSVEKGVFRVDGVDMSRDVPQLFHKNSGAAYLDGVGDHYRANFWASVAPLALVSNQVASQHFRLAAKKCYLTGFKAEVFELTCTLPLLCRFMAQFKKINRFRTTWNINFTNPSLCHQAFTHASYLECGSYAAQSPQFLQLRVRLGLKFTKSKQKKRKEPEPATELQNISKSHVEMDFKPLDYSPYQASYERVEFLGDAVLSLIVASVTFLKLQNALEGQLSQFRSNLVSNRTLGAMAVFLGFEDLVQSAFDIKAIPEPHKTKIMADTLEAVLGAIFFDKGLSHGLESCRAFFGALLREFDAELCELLYLSEVELQQHVCAYLEHDDAAFQQHPVADIHILEHEKFQSTNNAIPIKRTHLWLRALTHKSFKEFSNDSEVYLPSGHGSYERLEFLGDAVLQAVTSYHLLQTFPYHQQNFLTKIRSSLVKNARLAEIGTKLNYEQYIRVGGSALGNHINIAPVLADVFEAMLAVAFLENWSLEPIASFLDHQLFSMINEAVRQREWMSQRQKLTHRLHKWSPSSKLTSSAIEPWLTGQDNSQHALALYIDGYLISRASAKTIEMAWELAATKAMQLLGL